MMMMMIHTDLFAQFNTQSSCNSSTHPVFMSARYSFVVLLSCRDNSHPLKLNPLHERKKAKIKIIWRRLHLYARISIGKCKKAVDAEYASRKAFRKNSEWNINNFKSLPIQRPMEPIQRRLLSEGIKCGQEYALKERYFHWNVYASYR